METGNWYHPTLFLILPFYNCHDNIKINSLKLYSFEQCYMYSTCVHVRTIMLHTGSDPQRVELDVVYIDSINI